MSDPDDQFDMARLLDQPVPTTVPCIIGCGRPSELPGDVCAPCWAEIEHAIDVQAGENPDPPLLACGHPDNDPTVYHNNPDQQPVCAACCHECNPEAT